MDHLVWNVSAHFPTHGILAVNQYLHQPALPPLSTWSPFTMYFTFRVYFHALSSSISAVSSSSSSRRRGRAGLEGGGHQSDCDVHYKAFLTRKLSRWVQVRKRDDCLDLLKSIRTFPRNQVEIWGLQYSRHFNQHLTEQLYMAELHYTHTHTYNTHTISISPSIAGRFAWRQVDLCHIDSLLQNKWLFYTHLNNFFPFIQQTPVWKWQEKQEYVQPNECMSFRIEYRLNISYGIHPLQVITEMFT